MSTTIRQRRQELGMSREELAELIGVTTHMVGRWEEIGFDAEPGSRIGDYFIGRVMAALDVEEGLVFPYVPDAPKSGDFVITPADGPEALMEEIIERAEELSLRMAVPDRFGQHLVASKDLTDEDETAISEYFEGERKHAERIVSRMESVLELLGGNSGEWKPGQTMGERLEEVERDLDREVGGGE